MINVCTTKWLHNYHFVVYTINIKYPTRRVELLYTSEAYITSFINEYLRSRVVIETSLKAVINRALNNEERFEKAFYCFTKEEILEMYTDAQTRSIRSLSNWNKILRDASMWILEKEGKPLNSVYDEITKEDLATCIDEDKVDKLMITREQLNMMQAELINKTDIALLELMFRGVTGGDWMRELTYLEPEQVSHKELRIYFKNGKVVPIDEGAYDILQDAFEETELVAYTATMRVSRVTGRSIYKSRFNAVHSNDNIKDSDDAERRFRWAQRRLYIISEYLDVSLTPKSLNASGFWHESHIEMNELGIEDFKDYLRTENGKKLAYRFGFTTSNYIGVIFDKFRKYL